MDSNKYLHSYTSIQKQSSPDIELGVLGGTKDEVGSDIEVDITQLRYILTDLQQLSDRSKSTNTTKVLRRLRHQMNTSVETAIEVAYMMKRKLEADRTRMSVTNDLKTNVKELRRSFKKFEEDIVYEQKEDLKRLYINVIGVTPSEELVEKIFLEDGEQVESYESARHCESSNLVSKERHRAVKEIQKSLMELHQVFLDMAVLVESQRAEKDDTHVSQENMAPEWDESQALKGNKGVAFGLYLFFVCILVVGFVTKFW